MVKFGCIGTGTWGTKVIKAIRGLGYDVMVCNRHGEFEGLPVCTDYREMIPQVDIVWVATHPSTNCQIATSAIAHGKPTVVEKPVAFTSQEVAQLVRASKAKQVPLIVDYIHLFNHDLAAFTYHDPIKRMSLMLGNKGPNRDYSALWDYGSHALALALTWTRQPIQELSVERVDTPNVRYDVKLGFPSGFADIVVSNTTSERAVGFSIEGGGTSNFYCDTGQQLPLQCLIDKIARLHLSNEYWTNGDLAVEVTDVLERLHMMLPK